MINKTVSIDFDDTIRNRNDSPVSGVKNALSSLRKEGYRILIGSARLDPKIWGEQLNYRIKDIENWLTKNGIPYDDVVITKPPADLYVDDKGYRFEGDWAKAYDDIRSLLK